VLAVLLRRGLPADRIADGPVQPDMLEKAHWERRRGNAADGQYRRD